ncbi:MAG: GNAT family N-acetyltransferase [Acutalibacteraceae bacterium]
MPDEFINLNLENIDREHLCCIIRTKKSHPGVEAKRDWLKEQLGEGHIFRKLNAKATVFIEYAPLEKAWVPIVGDNYIYIYCLWVLGDFRGKGYGRSLMEYCIEDAKAHGRSGICMLGADKQKAWLSDQSFAQKFGFETVDKTDNGYELLALSFDGTKPHFAPNAKKLEIDSDDLTVFYDMQCPYVLQSVEKAKEYCAKNSIPASFIQVNSLRKAKELPCVFNNFAVFYGGKFVTVNLIDPVKLKKLTEK